MNEKINNKINDLSDSLKKLYGVFGYKPTKKSYTKSSNKTISNVFSLLLLIVGAFAAFMCFKAKEYMILVLVIGFVALYVLSIFFDNTDACVEQRLDEIVNQVNEVYSVADEFRLEAWNCREVSKDNEREIADLKQKVAKAISIPDGEKKIMKEIVSNLIALYDNQVIKRSFALSQTGSENSSVLQVIDSTITEILNTLKKYGVETVENKGNFCGSKQTIVNTMETDNQALEGQVADTVRIGFVHNGEYIRPQEVIVYTFKEF